MAETRKALFSTTTGGTVKDSDVMAYKETGGAGDPTRNHLFSVMKTFFQGLLPARITTNESDISTLETETDLNTVYKDRVKTKVLWTGPLSVVSTPTSLDGAEKFIDWDEVRVYVNTVSDTGVVNDLQTFSFSTNSGKLFFRVYNETSFLKFRKISDTTFELEIKGVALGNISLIEGISL